MFSNVHYIFNADTLPSAAAWCHVNFLRDTTPVCDVIGVDMPAIGDESMSADPISLAVTQAHGYEFLASNCLRIALITLTIQGHVARVH